MGGAGLGAYFLANSWYNHFMRKGSGTANDLITLAAGAVGGAIGGAGGALVGAALGASVL